MMRPRTDDQDDPIDPRLRRLAPHDLAPARAEALRSRCRRALGVRHGTRARIDRALGFALPAGAAVLSLGLVARVVVDAFSIFGLR